MGKCYFNNAWLRNENYSHWLSACKSNRRAMCRWCKKEFDVGNMGEHAIKSHATSKKHVLLQKLEQSNSKRTIMDSFKSPVGNYETPATSSPSSAPSTSSSSDVGKQTSMSNVVSGDAVLTAEIYHCLNLIDKHNSYHSSADAGDLYRLMFPDSLIAKKFQCADKKAAYLSTFGLGPYLKQCQFEAVNKSQHYVLLFDESLNSHMQSKQMDTHVRYWVGDTIQTRYFNSQFMGHARSDDLLECLRSSWESVGNRKGM